MKDGRFVSQSFSGWVESGSVLGVYSNHSFTSRVSKTYSTQPLMNYTYSVLSIVWIIGSCQPLLDSADAQDETAEPKLPTAALLTVNNQQWVLVREISGWTPQIIDYDTVERKTFYRFLSDQTFRKHTTHGDTVRGTYTLQSDSADATKPLVITLSYPEDYFFYNSCLSGQERMELQGDTLVNSALPCDGPKLFYVKR